MKRVTILAGLLGTVCTILGIANAAAQGGTTAQELTFFSNPGMSGAQFTVTGPRTNLTLPYTPRSAMRRGGGSWQICSQTEYRGKCQVLTSDVRDLSFGPVRSVRRIDSPVPTPGNWKEIARVDVRDRADRDTAASSDRQTLFREIKVCSDRNTIRLRRAEVQLGNGTWQRLFVPLVLAQGECSKNIELLGKARRIRSVRFEYEAWTVGMARGTVSVMALPHVQVQPR